MPVTRILLARHGQTDWNSVGRWQGHADPPLNAAGRDQARALAELLSGEGIVAVHSSDLQRASETAEIVAARLGVPVVHDPALREIDVGSWSGLTRAEVESRFPDGFALWQTGEIGHDGETREQLTERVIAALEQIAAAHPGRTALAVTHGGSIRAARRHVLGVSEPPLDNCGIVEVSFGADDSSLPAEAFPADLS